MQSNINRTDAKTSRNEQSSMGWTAQEPACLLQGWLEVPKRTSLIPVIALILAAAAGLWPAAGNCREWQGALPLLPAPRHVSLSRGYLELQPAKAVFVSAWFGGEEDRFALSTVTEDLAALSGFPETPVTAAAKGPWKSAALGNDRAVLAGLIARGPRNAEVRAAEGYAVSITPAGIAWWARTGRGFFYACQTVRQLLRIHQSRGWLPAAEIGDRPVFPMRGIHEDYGRDQVPTLEDCKRTIDRIAYLKMNTYFFYLEPDHFVYEFDPTIGRDADRFTRRELVDLVEYARLRRVEIIPVVECLGHLEELLRHPSYSHLAEVPGGPDLAPANPGSWDLLEKMLDEIVPCFDSPFFHVGCDETYTVGLGQSRALAERQGVAAVLAAWYERLRSYLAAHGKQMIMYADMMWQHPELIGLPSRDIVMMVWGYRPVPEYRGIELLAKAGYRVMGLAGNWDWAHVYPDTGEAFANIDVMADDAASCGALGQFIASWGDRGGENLSELNWYGYARAACDGWHPGRPLPTEFASTFVLQFFGRDSSDLAAAYRELAVINEYAGNLFDLFHSDPAQAAMRAGRLTQEEKQGFRRLREAAARIEERLAAAGAEGLPDNWDLLPALRLTAKRAAYVADKYLMLGEAAGRRESIAFLRDSLIEIDREYDRIWLGTNRPKHLEFLRSRFRGQIEEYEAMIGE